MTLDKDGRLILLKRLLTFSFLTFRSDETENRICKKRLVVAIILTAACTYQFISLLRSTLNNNLNFTSIIDSKVSWFLQCLCSVYFLIYWQFGHFERLFSMEIWKSENIHFRTWKTYLIFSIVSLLILAFMMFILVEYYFDNLTNFNIEKEGYEGFGKQLGAIAILITTFYELIWLLVLFIYTIAISRVSEELEAFNEQMKMIGKDSWNQEDLKTELLAKYDSLIDITDQIRQLNSMFEVYTFLMITTDIPISVFSITKLLQPQEIGFKYFYLFGAFIFIFELPPARISLALKSVEASVFSNKKLWFPCDEHKYRIALAIVEHCKQNIGISIWGFVIMNKSMILTIVSVTLTYFSVVIKMDANKTTQ